MRVFPILAAFLAACLLLVASCASAPTVATPEDAGPAQPAIATYSCDDGSSVTIQSAGGSIRVQAQDGSVVDLPASPPGQQNRFGLAGDAVVVEGREALVMRGNAEPLTCTR